MSNTRKTRVVVLISGSGSNLQVLIDQCLDHTLPIKIVSVISNKPDAAGLLRASKAGIKTHAVDHKKFLDKSAFEAQLTAKIDEADPDLIVLAGFMRILSAEFVNHYLGRMLNIHPSLLPKYRGLNTHQRALDDGENQHGVSVHFVTPELDGGPVIIQSQVPIESNETATSLAKKVQTQEHLIYPLAITWFSLGRTKLINGEIEHDGTRLKQAIQLN